MSHSTINLINKPSTEFGDLYNIPKFDSDDRNYFFELNDVEREVIARFHNTHKKVHFILILGYFKAKPVTLSFTWGQVKEDLQFIYQRYFPEAPKQRLNIEKNAKSDIYRHIAKLSGFRFFNRHLRQQLLEHARQSVSMQTDRKFVIDVCIAFLNWQWITLPSYSTIQRTVSKALAEEEQRLVSTMNEILSDDLKNYIDKLHSSEESKAEFDSLKKQAKDYTYSELTKEISNYSA